MQTHEKISKLIDLIAELNKIVISLGEVGVQASLGQSAPSARDPLAEDSAEIYFHLTAEANATRR